MAEGYVALGLEQPNLAIELMNSDALLGTVILIDGDSQFNFYRNEIDFSDNIETIEYNNGFEGFVLNSVEKMVEIEEKESRPYSWLKLTCTLQNASASVLIIEPSLH